MAEICGRRGVAIIADEIHCDLVYAGQRHVPIASLDPEVAARTVTLMSPSKTFNLAGLKCAIAVVTDAALREKFLATKVDLVANPERLRLRRRASPPIATAVPGSTPSWSISRPIATTP